VLTEEEQKKLEDTIDSGGFDMNTLKLQLKQMKNLGGMMSMAKFMPGKYKELLEKGADHQDQLDMQLKVIDAMTEEERKNPKMLTKNAAKLRIRIAATAGCTVQDVNRLLELFEKYKEGQKKLHELKKSGKPIPNNMSEVIQFLRK